RETPRSSRCSLGGGWWGAFWSARSWGPPGGRRAALDGWATTARSLAGVLGRLPQRPRRAA
ncbi:hypothetical protein ACFV8Z_25890, partial [Streptomyces sp. NPDC059837]